MAPGKAAVLAAAFLAAVAGALKAEDEETSAPSGSATAPPWPAVGRLSGERRSHGNWIFGVSWSGDGSRIRTSGVWGGQHIVEWDPTRGEPTAVHAPPPAKRKNDYDRWRLALSPDGTRLAAVLANGVGQVIDVATGKTSVSFEVPTDHLNWDADDLQWSPDGSRVAMCESDGSAMAWEAASGKLLWRVGFSQQHGNQIAWSPDGKALAAVGVGGEDWNKDHTAMNLMGQALVLDAADGRRLFEAKDSFPRTCSSAAFSPDGRLLAVHGGEGDKTLVFDWRAGKTVLTLETPGGELCTVGWSPDGTRLVTGCEDGRIRVWNATDGTLERSLIAPQGSETAAWSPDGRWIASGGFSGVLWIFDAATGARITPGEGHGSRVTAAAWSPDGSRIATTGEDGAVILWDGKSLRQAAVLRSTPGKDAERDSGLEGIAWSPDGRRLAASREDGGVSMFDPVKEEEVAVLAPPPVEEGGWLGPAGRLAFSPDGRRLAVGSEDPQARIWDVEAGKLVHLLDSRAGTLGVLGWSPDGSRVHARGSGAAAAIFEEGGVYAWDAATGKAIETPSSGWNLRGAALSPDGTRLATQEPDGTVRVFDATTLAPLARRNGPAEGGTATAFSADGVWVATGCAEGWWIVYDAATLTRLLAVQPGKKESAGGAWPPAGSLLARVDYGTPPVIWDPYPAPRAGAKGRAVLPVDGDERGRFLGELWNRLGDPRLEEGLLAEEDLAALGEKGVAFVAGRLRPAADAADPPPDPRTLRALRALVRSRAPGARDLLRSLAAGAAGAPLTRTAASCLRAWDGEGK